VREHPPEERTPSGCCVWDRIERDTAGIVCEYKNFRRRPKADQKTLWNCAIEEQMNRQVSFECEQMWRTEPSMKSVGKERMISLFNSTILQGDCHFVEQVFDFERRIKNDLPNVEQRYLELELKRKNLAKPE
jgi:hypothetical protein